ncbi:MAG: hypothetical protein QHH09_02905 [Microgenomates group bacterium]|nr:hypothetical protein [Microgenomates group bacterium]
MKNKKNRVNSSTIFLLIVLIFFAGLLFKKIVNEGQRKNFQTKIIPNVVKKVINNDQTKFSVDSVKDTNGVFEFELSIGTGSAAQKYTSYITKDGKLLFTSGIKVDQLNQQAPQSQSQTKKLTCNDIKKSQTPKLTAFVVSNCPYGLQMQRTFKMAINQQPQLSQNLQVKYIGSIENGKITSMHGDKEAKENLRQICIREEQANKYWDYLSCYMQKGESDKCLTSSGINTNTLDQCTNDSNRGLKYAKADFDMANKYNVSGSPTLIMNDEQVVSEFDFGGRTPNAIQTLICCGSQNKVSYCDKEISKESAATSFSETDVAGASTNTAAGCN